MSGCMTYKPIRMVKKRFFDVVADEYVETLQCGHKVRNHYFGTRRGCPFCKRERRQVTR